MLEILEEKFKISRSSLLLGAALFQSLNLLKQHSFCICTCERLLTVCATLFHFSASYQLSKKKVLSADLEEGDVKTTVMRTFSSGLLANQRAP